MISFLAYNCPFTIVKCIEEGTAVREVVQLIIMFPISLYMYLKGITLVNIYVDRTGRPRVVRDGGAPHKASYVDIIANVQL